MSIVLFICAIAALVAGYVWYGTRISRIFALDPARITPAHTKYDGVDYVPAKWFVLFGHHFSSIAGAGPIIGPILAYIWWGWIGTLLWIVVGSIFIGAVHDFTALIISVREGGSSIGQVAQTYISRNARIVFLLFLWFALILVIAVFAAVCAKSYINEPHIVVPSLGLIPVAVVVGLLLYRLKLPLAVPTVIGVAGMAALIVAGRYVPVTLTGPASYNIWIAVLLIYSFIASVTPVHLLLQPRDYISSYLLYAGIAALFIGLISKPLPLAGATLFTLRSDGGYLFPAMFITVACGAISGFHSLVASGTTSKQLSNERHARIVGFGGMIVEAVLAVGVLFCVAFGLKGVQTAGQEPTALFALGFASVDSIFGPYATLFAFVLLNAFILTTLDTATRIARFLTEELLPIRNRLVSTALVVSLSAFLALGNKWQKLWSVFGASNQLVAALALIVVSSWLLAHKKKYLFTFIPAIIMIIITVIALLLKSIEFFHTKEYLLFCLSSLLMVFGLAGIFEFRRMKTCRVNPERN